ncbi:IS5 family transposase [Shinella yambaruensis]|uniref:IS5 family transposase n=1 Tax=Shinella yambaruensis TaxID=415996 RepID=UPI003D7AECA2
MIPSILSGGIEMVDRKAGQFSFADALVTVRAGSDRLGKLSSVVKWYRFEKVLKPLACESETGRPAYAPVMLFKALLLQRLYGLSDLELEEALYDRLSFRRFCGLGLEAAVPDHTTLCRFRNRLVDRGVLEKLFCELDRQLDAAGLILRRGTMLDATVIETGAASRPPREGDGAGEAGRDKDAAFTRRKGKAGSSYGYKAHVGVGEGSGLIRRVITTPANVNDTVPADGLICGDEGYVLADSAYHTHERERRLKAAGIGCGLMRRANKHHPRLTPAARRFNRAVARRRAAVETTFATLKRRMGLDTIRYVGLARAAGQVLLAAIAFNMRRWVTLAT